MSIHRRGPLQEQEGVDDTTSCTRSRTTAFAKSDYDSLSPLGGEGMPTRLQRENDTLKLQIREQQEKLRWLEEQIRLATFQSENSCSGGSILANSSSSSGSNRRRKPPQTLKRRHGVNFCEEVLCYANTRSYDQIVGSWYSKDELAVFKGERKNLIRELKRVDFDLDKIDRNKYHLRGLEPYLSVRYNKYMQKKREGVLQTVMSVQKKQMKEGKWEPEALRIACCEASAWARERAADLGRRDAKAVGNEIISSLRSKSSSSNFGCSSDRSDHSTGAWSTCSATASTSTHSTLSFGGESIDSLELQSPTMVPRYRVKLERVDELPSPL